MAEHERLAGIDERLSLLLRSSWTGQNRERMAHDKFAALGCSLVEDIGGRVDAPGHENAIKFAGRERPRARGRGHPG